jgi:type III pantothenate kinase
MLLAIDIGNSNIVLGVYDEERLITCWRAATKAERTTDEYAVLLANFFAQEDVSFASMDGCIISNVVPPLTPVFLELCERYLDTTPLVVGAGIKTGVRIRYDNPQQLGADRMVNALAAKRLYGTPAIVVDFGTATKFECLSAEGDYLGGAIAPGIGISVEALFRHTAKLPRIELALPPRAIGTNTVASMQSGVLYGYVGLVEGLVRRLKRELGGQARVIATGGLASVIAAQTPVIETVDPDLTLQGLRLIYEMNRG